MNELLHVEINRFLKRLGQLKQTYQTEFEANEMQLCDQLMTCMRGVRKKIVELQKKNRWINGTSVILKNNHTFGKGDVVGSKEVDLYLIKWERIYPMSDPPRKTVWLHKSILMLSDDLKKEHNDRLVESA